MSDQDHGGHNRRRSVDVGGLALALGNQGLGHGWGGWEEREKGEIRYCDHCIYPIVSTKAGIGFRYAELLSEMYTQTQSTVNSHRLHL